MGRGGLRFEFFYKFKLLRSINFVFYGMNNFYRF